MMPTFFCGDFNEFASTFLRKHEMYACIDELVKIN